MKVRTSYCENSSDGTKITYLRPVEGLRIRPAAGSSTSLRGPMTRGGLIDPVSFVFLVLGATVIVIGFAVLLLW